MYSVEIILYIVKIFILRGFIVNTYLYIYCLVFIDFLRIYDPFLVQKPNNLKLTKTSFVCEQSLQSCIQN